MGAMTDQPTEAYFKARAAAGRAAVVIANDHREDIAAEMMLGLIGGFVSAAARLRGWDAVLAHVNEIARTERAPAEYQRPLLFIIKGDAA